MHLQWFEAGALGTNAIVGGGYDGGRQRLGAEALRHRRPHDQLLRRRAANIGSVLESLNLTSAWQLPLCFFIENNLYAVSTTVEEATGEPRLSARALGFGIPAWRVDGMDPSPCICDAASAGEAARGDGPVVVEAVVYRFFPPERSFPGSASATAPRRKRPPGVPATRSIASRRR